MSDTEQVLLCLACVAGGFLVGYVYAARKVAVAQTTGGTGDPSASWFAEWGAMP
jgi:hypothetical protein